MPLPWYNFSPFTFSGTTANSRLPLTPSTFLCFLLPPLLCYYLSAIFVVLPLTRLQRLVPLPLTLWLAFRALASLDLASGWQSERLCYLNHGLMIVVTALSMRIVTWSFQRRPLERVAKKISNVATIANRNQDSNWDKSPLNFSNCHFKCPSNATWKANLPQSLFDAFDLCCNFRGIGWTWSSHLQIPTLRSPRQQSYSRFLLSTTFSLLFHICFFDILHYSIQSLSPSTIGSPNGGTIFDPSLPPTSSQRYLDPRAFLITFFSGFVVYSLIQSMYDFLAILGVGVFRQHPDMWPPAFDEPWRASSLKEFWARRWHQVFRDSFLSLGARPAEMFVDLLVRAAGRRGAINAQAVARAVSVLGAFLVSGVLHDVGLRSMCVGGVDKPHHHQRLTLQSRFFDSDFIPIAGFFLVNAIGILFEQSWRAFTRCRVRGLAGWTWTVLWIVFWAQFLVDAWARRGLMGSRFLPVGWRLGTWLFGPLPDD